MTSMAAERLTAVVNRHVRGGEMTDTGGFFKPDSDEDTEAFKKRVFEALGIAPNAQTDEREERAEEEPGDDH